MNEGDPFIDNALQLLEEVKKHLARDVAESAREDLDKVIILLREAKRERADRSLLKQKLLDALPIVIEASGRFASLIETVMNQIP